MKKLLSILLAALIVVPMLAACGGGSTEPAQTTASGNAEVQTDAQTEDNTPKLAFDKQNYNGKTFNVLSVLECAYEYDAPEQTGERVNDAVYERNGLAEDYLGLKLNFILEQGGWSYRNTYNALITNSIAAGDGAYDYVTGMISCIQPLASSALFTNLFEVPNLDMDNPWWVSSMQKELALNGKLFGIIGDVCLSMYKGFSVFFFNKRMLEDVKMEDPYDVVRSGKWTLDKMMEMTSGLGRDVNGDGNFTLGDDVYSIIISDVPARSWNSALDIHIVEIGDDGIPHVAPLSEKAVTAIEKLTPYYHTNDLYQKDTSALETNFMQGESYWYLGKLESMEKYGDMEDDFGIIPMPKYDADQPDYYTQIATASLMIFVPLTVNDPAMTGHVLETLSYLTWKSVVSAYYETSLGQRYARDGATAEMLEIIRAHASNGFDYSYSTTIGGSPWVNSFVHGLSRDSKDPASTHASQLPTWEAAIQTILENYK